MQLESFIIKKEKINKKTITDIIILIFPHHFIKMNFVKISEKLKLEKRFGEKNTPLIIQK